MLLLLRNESGASSVARSFAIRVMLLAVNFGTGVIVARSLGPDGRGAQAAIALWPPLLAALATFGMPTALNYCSRRQPADAGRLYMSSVVAMTLVGLLASAAGAAAIPHLLHGFDERTVHEAQWFMLFAPETLVISVARAHLEALGKFTRSALVLLYPPVFTLAGLLVLRLSGHLTPLTAALSYMVPTTIQAIYLGIRLWQPKAFRFWELGHDLRALLPYGLRCYGSDVINGLSGQMDLVVIVSFLSPKDLGLYTVALSLSRLVTIGHSSLVSTLFPRATSLEPHEAIDLVVRAGRLSTLFGVGLALIFMMVLPIALPLVYGSEFSSALGIIPLLMLEAILSGAAWVLFQGFMSTGHPAIVTAIQLCWLVVALLLLFALVPRMHSAGAATALLGAAIFRLGLVLTAYPIVLKRQVPISILTSADFAYVKMKLSGLRVST